MTGYSAPSRTASSPVPPASWARTSRWHRTVGENRHGRRVLQHCPQAFARELHDPGGSMIEGTGHSDVSCPRSSSVVRVSSDSDTPTMARSWSGTMDGSGRPERCRRGPAKCRIRRAGTGWGCSVMKFAPAPRTSTPSARQAPPARSTAGNTCSMPSASICRAAPPRACDAR